MIHRDDAAHEALVLLRELPEHAVDCNHLLTVATAGSLGSIPKKMINKLRLHNSRRVLRCV